MNHERLNRAVADGLGPRAIAVAGTLDWLESSGFKLVKTSDDSRTMFFDAPQVPGYDDEIDRARFPDSRSIAKRAQEMFDDVCDGREITLRFKFPPPATD